MLTLQVKTGVRDGPSSVTKLKFRPGLSTYKTEIALYSGAAIMEQARFKSAVGKYGAAARFLTFSGTGCLVDCDMLCPATPDADGSLMSILQLDADPAVKTSVLTQFCN